jgi:hypothetical protein
MNKISKPPWRVGSYLEPFDSVIKTWQVVSAEDLIVAKCGKGDFEIEANAKLISAAPDMMKMLEKMAEALEKCREGFEYTRQYVGYDTLPAIDGWTWYDADCAAEQALQEYREMKDATK